MTLEQEFSSLVSDPSEQERDRRQTTDPDQLCPTVASFVMPRVGVNSQGMLFLFHLLMLMPIPLLILDVFCFESLSNLSPPVLS